MRRFPIALLVCGAVLPAQETMPIGILRGSLIAWRGGNLSVQQANGAIYDCSYDNHTLFQRNEWPIQSADLNGGEPVEVLADWRPGNNECYVRMLSVIYGLPKSRRRAVPQRTAPVIGVGGPARISDLFWFSRRERELEHHSQDHGRATYIATSQQYALHRCCRVVGKQTRVRVGGAQRAGST
jgi:hypothetical protein